MKISQKRKKNKNLFIVFEGLSGTGKTTIAKKIAKKLEAVYYKTPPPPFLFLRDEVDKSCDYQSRFFFYLSGIIYASKQIKIILEDRSVICDRYILTTICFHKALGINFSYILNGLSIIKPDFTFLITCDEKERRRRLRRRGLTYNDQMEIKLRTDKRFLSEYRKYSLLEIDNSSFSTRKAIEQILNILNKKDDRK